ncbi:hypothetical protein GTY54_27440, partial [Streptomyces sp. SID625]|nr:hypothetical protein [Streptomyces sp. SID625]
PHRPQGHRVLHPAGPAPLDGRAHDVRLSGCRRLHRRYERKAEHFLAFTAIACSLICYRRLTK